MKQSLQLKKDSKEGSVTLFQRWDGRFMEINTIEKEVKLGPPSILALQRNGDVAPIEDLLKMFNRNFLEEKQLSENDIEFVKNTIWRKFPMMSYPAIKMALWDGMAGEKIWKLEPAMIIRWLQTWRSKRVEYAPHR